MRLRDLLNTQKLRFKATKALREKISTLPVIDVSSATSEAERRWMDHRIRVRSLILNSDPYKFLTWDVIRHTMFVDEPPYIQQELRTLQGSSDWDKRWSHAIRESIVGCPHKYSSYPLSSGNLIHHAFSLYQFENRTGQTVQQLQTIVEFGGGYGSMCRLAYNLGFKGKYIIFDLPEFSAIQQFFLTVNRISASDTPDSYTGGVLCLSNYSHLASVMNGQTLDLFIATWSISETSMFIRSSILPLVANCSSYLIAYQDQFEEVNNVDFFSTWSANCHDVKWENWRIPHLPGNNYLMGVRKVADR